MARFAIGVTIGVMLGLAAGLAMGAAIGHASEESSTDTLEAPEESSYDVVWDRLAQCESSGRWSINTGNGYYGGLQQDMTFWRRHGGLQYAPRPDLASRLAQIAVAQVGLAAQGFGAWPACSRILGLR